MTQWGSDGTLFFMPKPNPEFDDAWARFQALDSLILGPETLESAWSHGRDRYAALLIPVDDPDTVAHARGALSELSHVPGLEPYPEPYWHITIKGIGFLCDKATEPDEISEEQINVVSEQIGDMLSAQPQFQIRAGHINAFPEVVIIEAWDDGYVRNLNTQILETIRGLARHPFDGPTFLPHISIARFASDEGLSALKTTLTELRESPPGPTFTAKHANLICAHLSAGAPTFELMRRYELGR